jgi:hypothetical protein
LVEAKALDGLIGGACRIAASDWPPAKPIPGNLRCTHARNACVGRAGKRARASLCCPTHTVKGGGASASDLASLFLMVG